MAFVKVNKSAVGSSTNRTTPLIRMGSHLQSAKQSSRSVYFAINQKTIQLVGWTIKRIETMDEGQSRSVVNVAVNEGTYEDAGFLMLAEDPKGYALGSNKGTSDESIMYSLAMSVSVTRLMHYVLNDVTIDIAPEEVEFTIDENEHTILIQCPDWLRYNPLSLPDKEPPPLEKPEVKPEPRSLNREERRRLAKTVASTLRR